MRILTIVLLTVALSASARAEVIDRILATVGGALILQSDAVAAARLGFVELPAQGNPLQFTLDRLIERRRLHVRDDLRIEGYVQQRFGTAYRPSDEEVVAHYRSHGEEFMKDGKVQPFEAVRDLARSSLIAERQAAAVREWMASLRRRTEVNVLYLGR